MRLFHLRLRKGNYKGVVNRTGCFILSLCDGNRDIESIYVKLCGEFPEIDKETLRRDLIEFIENCIQKGVLDA